MNRIFVLLAAMLFCNCIYATTLSGTNTGQRTLTKANSPYIVNSFFSVDSLFIEPGVEIRFDKGARIDAQKVIARGTAIDSIRFTSNEITPAMNDWQFLSIRAYNADSSSFDYCIFEYSERGIHAQFSRIIIEHSRFSNVSLALHLGLCTGVVRNNLICDGGTGMFADLVLNSDINGNRFFNLSCGINIPTNSRMKFRNNTIEKCSRGVMYDNYYFGTRVTLENNLITNNKYGIWSRGTDSLLANNNILSYNDTAVFLYYSRGYFNNNSVKYNKIGFYIYTDQVSSGTFSNNCFEGNSNFHVRNTSKNDFDFRNNYWTVTDSAGIHAKIYDYYTNPDSGKILFVPFLTKADSSCKHVDPPTNVESKTAIASSVTAYPNPFTSSFTIDVKSTGNVKEISVYNMVGTRVATLPVSNKNTFSVDMDKYPAGLYLYKVVFANSEVYSGMLLKQ